MQRFMSLPYIQILQSGVAIPYTSI